jgi:hypothetical protein
MKRYASLRHKLTALIAGGGVVSAVIAAAGFSWMDLNRFRQNTNAQDAQPPAVTAAAVVASPARR